MAAGSNGVRPKGSPFLEQVRMRALPSRFSGV